MSSLGGRNRDRKQGREHLPDEFDFRTRLGGQKPLEGDAGEPVAVFVAGCGMMVRVNLIARNAACFNPIQRLDTAGIRKIDQDGVRLVDRTRARRGCRVHGKHHCQDEYNEPSNHHL